MKKQDEVNDSESCLNKAKDDEPIFVLLGRDRAASWAIHDWCNYRVRLCLNGPTDEKIMAARRLADEMQAYRIRQGIPNFDKPETDE